jgi:hypothetical protein
MSSSSDRPKLHRPAGRSVSMQPAVRGTALVGVGARAKARLGQSLSAAQHAEDHLQVVGVGEWRPTSTRPSWNAEPRLTHAEDS